MGCSQKASLVHFDRSEPPSETLLWSCGRGDTHSPHPDIITLLFVMSNPSDAHGLQGGWFTTSSGFILALLHACAPWHDKCNGAMSSSSDLFLEIRWGS